MARPADITVDRPSNEGRSIARARPLTLYPESKSPIRGIDSGVLEAQLSVPMDTMVAIGEWGVFLASGYSDKTQEMYLRSTMRFFRDTKISMFDTSETDLARWLEQFAYRSSSRRTHYNGLLSFFSWAVRNGYLHENPLSGIRVPAPFEKVPRALSEEQYEAVRAAAYRHHPVRGYTVELLFFSAGRISEILNLTWDDITDEGIVFRHTKSGHERLVQWTEGLRRAVLGLKQWYGHETRVLPRCSQTVSIWLQKAGDDAGVPGVHPHLFRSTSATRMLVRGARPHAVKDILGHAKIQTTTRYWAIEDADKQEALALLDEGEGNGHPGVAARDQRAGDHHPAGSGGEVGGPGDRVDRPQGPRRFAQTA